jgi:metal-responsive CopG/Arc/MetJ family transcriptional regulator
MRMPTKTLTVLLPAEVLDKVDEHARSLCLSRSAAVRLILLEEMKRRSNEIFNALPEVAA